MDTDTYFTAFDSLSVVMCQVFFRLSVHMRPDFASCLKTALDSAHTCIPKLLT